MSELESPKAVESVCVGIVAYNTPGEVLEGTLFALKKGAPDVDLAVHVLCNSPSPEYHELVMRVCEAHGARYVGPEPNHGFGAAHNTLVRGTLAKWYVCCNPDVRVEPGAIRALLDFAKEHQDAALLAPAVFDPGGGVQKLSRRHLSLFTWGLRQAWRLAPSIFKPFEATFDYARPQPLEFVSGCFFLTRRDFFLGLGGYDEDFFLYCEDADLSLRASALGTNYYVPAARVVHEWQQAWTRSRRALKQQLSSLLRFFLKHKRIF